MTSLTSPPTSSSIRLSPPEQLTADVLHDLEVGRSQAWRPAEPVLSPAARPRPTVDGWTFRRTYLAAKVLGRIHPRLARRSLLKLWFTPWVHPSALRPVADLPEGLRPWTLATAGPQLHGFHGGAGPTAVLVHGWAGRAADWRHLASDLLAAGWRVVAPDLPAHGRTPGDRTDLFELGRALAAVLDRERPAVVVAHSMGFPATLRALEEGARRPDLIVALAPGRSITRALAGFATRARLRPALVDELRRGLEDRFGADVWEVLDADRVVPALAPEAWSSTTPATRRCRSPTASTSPTGGRERRSRPPRGSATAASCVTSGCGPGSSAGCRDHRHGRSAERVRPDLEPSRFSPRPHRVARAGCGARAPRPRAR
jgi:pimeloyl-ACP methyl ester carboxylesterase